MHQGLGLHAVVHVHAQLQQAVVQGEEHGMARAVRGIAGTPFGRAAEGPGMDQAFILGLFRGLKGFAALVIGVFAGHHPAPGHAHPGHFAHGDGRGLGEQAGHLLVAAPVRAFDRVVEMNFRAVAVAHDGIAQGRLHAAHGRRGMGAPGRHQTQTDDAEARLRGFHGHALPGQTGAHAENITLKNTHTHPPIPGTRRGSEPARRAQGNSP